LKNDDVTTKGILVFARGKHVTYFLSWFWKMYTPFFLNGLLK